MKFIKMHGLGNDFVIFDCLTASHKLTPDQVRSIANRREGIGCDQVGIINPSQNADCFMPIYNADGGEVGACGNITRCVALYLMNKLNKDAVDIETIEGVLECSKASNGDIKVNMGIPKISWEQIPLSKEMDTLNIDFQAGEFKNPVCVNVGNPHCIFIVDDLENIDLEKNGNYVEHHNLFPERTNVEFIKILDRNTIRMKVWERGTGVTKACGTGACASFIAAHRRGLVDNSAKVILDGGELDISVDKNTGDIYMTGSATFVFEGKITLP